MSNTVVTRDVDLLDDYGDAMDAATVRADREACDWLELRRAILAYGGIGASRDFPRDWIPGDLYRAAGKAPDLVAAEALHPAPWGDTGDDSAMLAYLRRSYAQWERVKAREQAGRSRHRDGGVSGPVRAEHPVPVSSPHRAPGTRSFTELVAELQRKHGADVDLAGLRSEYVQAYETGERVTLERDGRTYRGTVGATRGPRPRFVLLLSMDL